MTEEHLLNSLDRCRVIRNTVTLCTEVLRGRLDKGK